MGGRNIAWQPSRKRGQSSDGAVSAAALTSPRAAAQTGVHVRSLVRKPVVAGRRGGSASAPCAGALPWTTVEWTGWPARPNDSTILGRGRSSSMPAPPLLPGEAEEEDDVEPVELSGKPLSEIILGDWR
jgi:hypothetical protein